MASPHNIPKEFRNTIIIEYDAIFYNGDLIRMRQEFKDEYKARSLYLEKARKGRNPKVINPNKEKDNG